MSDILLPLSRNEAIYLLAPLGQAKGSGAPPDHPLCVIYSRLLGLLEDDKTVERVLAGIPDQGK